jgi:hypothetical protein
MISISPDYRRHIDNIEVLTPRIESLRNLYYESEAYICPVRSHLATLSWKETEGQPLHLRRAKLFAKICIDRRFTNLFFSRGGVTTGFQLKGGL